MRLLWAAFLISGSRRREKTGQVDELATFEEGFRSADAAAQTALKAAKAVVKAAAMLQKATSVGDLDAMRQSTEQLSSAASVAAQAGLNVRGAWPFTPEAEEQYLREKYELEVLDLARTRGVTATRGDAGGLIIYPSVLHVLPSERAVRVDRKKHRGLRPLSLLEFLRERQQKKPSGSSAAFLELLYKTARLLLDADTPRGQVTLSRIYAALTIRGGGAGEYTAIDFGRDLYQLSSSGLKSTRNGGPFQLVPPSTASKSGTGIFAFVGLDGRRETYYAIEFREPAQ